MALTLEEFLPKARQLNPDYTDDEHIQAYEQRYGRSKPVQTVSPAPLTTFEQFLPKARALNPDYSDEEHYAAWQEKYGARGAREKDQGDFVRGGVTAFKQIPQTIRGLEAGAGAIGEKIAGEGGLFTALKEHGLKGYQEHAADIAKDSKSSDSVTDAYKMAKAGDAGALVDWLQYALGYGGGQALQMLATAGVGYAGGKMALQPAAKVVAEKMIAKESARLAATGMAGAQLAKQAVSNVAGKIGQIGAIGATAVGMEGGEIYGGLVEKAAAEGRSLTGEELAKAAGATLGAGILEFVGDKIGLDLILGKSVAGKLVSSRLGHAVGAGSLGVATEGGTEFTQTLVEEFGKGNDPLAPESIKQAVDAAAMGGVGGASMGAAGGLLSRPQGRDEQPIVTERTPEDMGVGARTPLQIEGPSQPLQLEGPTGAPGIEGPPQPGELRKGTVYAPGEVFDVSPLPDVSPTAVVDPSRVLNAADLDSAIAGALGIVQAPTEAAKARASEYARMTAKAKNETDALLAKAPEKRPAFEVPTLPGPEAQPATLLTQPSPIVLGQAFTPRPDPIDDPRARLAEERSRMVAQREQQRMQQPVNPVSEPVAPAQSVEPADTPLPSQVDLAYPSSKQVRDLIHEKGLHLDTPVFQEILRQTVGKEKFTDLTPQELETLAEAVHKIKSPQSPTQTQEAPPQVPLTPTEPTERPYAPVTTIPEAQVPRSELPPEKNAEILLRAEKAKADMEIAGTERGGRFFQEQQGAGSTQDVTGLKSATADWYKELTSGPSPAIRGDRKQSAREKIEVAIAKIIKDQGADRGKAVEQVKAALLQDTEFHQTEWGRDLNSILQGDWPSWVEKPAQPSGETPGSWVIRNKTTGEVVQETFNPQAVERLNKEKYEAIPAQEYLGSINTEEKRQANAEKFQNVPRGTPQATVEEPKKVPLSRKERLAQQKQKMEGKAGRAKDSVDAVIAEYLESGRVAVRYPRRGTVSVDGREMAERDAVTKMKGVLANAKQAEPLPSEAPGMETQLATASPEREPAPPTSEAAPKPTVKTGNYRAETKVGPVQVSVEPHEEFEQSYRVTAIHGGEEVGSMTIGPNRFDDNEWSAMNVSVDSGMRRKGIATAMYDAAQKAGIHPIVPDTKQSDDARKFWDKRRKGKTSTVIGESEPFSLSSPEVSKPKAKEQGPEQLGIDVPPPTVGERPIIGGEATLAEAPLFSKNAQTPDTEQTTLSEPIENPEDATVIPKQEAESSAQSIAPEITPAQSEPAQSPETAQSPTTILADALRTAADKIEGKQSAPAEGPLPNQARQKANEKVRQDWGLLNVQEAAGKPTTQEVSQKEEPAPDEPVASIRQVGIPSSTEPVIFSYRKNEPVKIHKEYAAAKRGDVQAAVRLVNKLVKPDTRQVVASRFSGSVFVAPMAQEVSGKNAIPQALAAHYASAANGSLDTRIVQVNKPRHTGADPMQRIIARAQFAGAVRQGQRYVLVDDNLTLGGTLADLSDYIQRNGGEVAGIVVLTNANRSGTLQARPKQIRTIEERFGDVLREQIAIDPQALTGPEADYLIGLRDADALRARAAKAGREREQRLSAKGLSQPEDSVTPDSDSLQIEKPESPFSFLTDERGSIPASWFTRGENETGTIDPIETREKLSAAKSSLRPYLLGALGLEQLSQVYGKDHAEVRQYNKATQAMEADFTEMSRDSDKVARAWTDLNIPVADKMAQVMEDARFLNFDPDPKKSQEIDSEKKQKLRDRFDQLPEDAKSVYRMARDFYTNMAEQRFQALKERIERAGGTPENTRKLVDRLQIAYEQVRSKVYFPFSRFGEHIVVAKQMKDGKEVDREVHAFESTVEAQKFATMMKLKGWQVKQTVAREYSVDKEGPASKIVRQMHDIIKDLGQGQQGLPGVLNLEDQLLDSLNQSFLQALPDMSYAKHFIHAKDVKGASKDALRAFAHSALHGAHHISRIRHADKVTKALLNLDKTINDTVEGDTTEARQVYNELVKRHNDIMNPNTHPFAAWLGQLGFTMSLGGVVATGITNATQVPLVTYPWMGARYGFGKASAALARAYRDFLDPRTLNKDSLFDATKSKLISESERKMLLELARRGHIDLTQTMDLAGLSSRDNLSRKARTLGTVGEKVTRMLGFTFHVPEVMNRQVTALSTFRLEKERGGSFEEALERAQQAIQDTHFIYQCVDTETDCMTPSGWKRYDELQVGETIYGTDENGALIETTVEAVNIHRGEHKVLSMVNQDGFSMVVTENHRCVTQLRDNRLKKWLKPRLTEARDLQYFHTLLRSPLGARLEREAVYEDDFVSLLAWVVAEGSYRKTNKSTVTISQSIAHNPARVAEIEALLNRLGGHYRRYDVFDKRRPDYHGINFVLRRPLSYAVREALPDKMITPEFMDKLTVDQMRLFVETFGKGDGYRISGLRITQKDRGTLDMLQVMATITGNTSYVSQVKHGRHMWHVLYICSTTKRSYVKCLKPERIVVDTVWCPTTTCGTWIARRGGRTFVTGNSHNRPRYMQGNFLRVLTQFKQYSQNIAYTYGRAASIWLDKNGATKEERAIAKRQLVSMLALQFGAAGALGMPFFGSAADLLMAVVGAFGDDDDKREWEVALRKWLDGTATSLADAFMDDKEQAGKVGKEIAEVVAHGASRLTPWDMATRLGQNDLFFREPQREREGRQAVMDWMLALGGPVPSYGVNFLLGMGDVAKGVTELNGGFFMRGVEELTPAVLRNGVKSLRYTLEGVRTRDEYKQLELDTSEKLGQVFGFTPSRVAEMYESTTAVKNKEHRILNEQKSLKNRFARAVDDQDDNAKQRILEDIRGFNERNPIFAITSNTLNRSLKARRQHEAGMERGMYLPPRRRALLDEGEFGDF